MLKLWQQTLSNYEFLGARLYLESPDWNGPNWSYLHSTVFVDTPVGIPNIKVPFCSFPIGGRHGCLETNLSKNSGSQELGDCFPPRQVLLHPRAGPLQLLSYAAGNPGSSPCMAALEAVLGQTRFCRILDLQAKADSLRQETFLPLASQSW